MLKNSLSFLFVFISSLLFSQEKFSKEFLFTTDNDLYVSKTQDKYYTSGAFLSYRYLSKKKNPKTAKQIIEWQLGHEMYTPFKVVLTDISMHDRPFAAYLYLSYGERKIYKNNRIFSTSMQLGTIGANAIGKELQNFTHDIYGFDKAVGWKHQIKNALGVNITANYDQFLAKNSTNHVDLTWINEVKLGTVYTNINTGLFTRIGFETLQKMINSIAFGTSINNNTTKYKREKEVFFYAKSILSYAFYDATLQGSFLNKNSEVTKDLIPFSWKHELGIQFTVNRFNFKYAYIHNSSKSKGLNFENGTNYGRISFNYLFY